MCVRVHLPPPKPAKKLFCLNLTTGRFPPLPQISGGELVVYVCTLLSLVVYVCEKTGLILSEQNFVSSLRLRKNWFDFVEQNC